LLDGAVESLQNFLPVVKIVFYVVPIIHMIRTVIKLKVWIILIHFLFFIGWHPIFLEAAVNEIGDAILQIWFVLIQFFHLLSGEQETEVDGGSDVQNHLNKLL